MKILIVTATKFEVAPLLQGFDFKMISDQRLYEYCTPKNTIHVLITGIGITSTAYFLIKALHAQSYNFAMNTGVCGSFKVEFPVGTTVRIMKDTIADLGIEDRETFIPAELWLDEHKISQSLFAGKCNNTLPLNAFSKLPQASGITVNTASGCAETIIKRRNLFHPDVESMEGAAFMSICNKENLDCEQIRTVSNYVEPRNEKAWDIHLAVNNLNDFLFRFLASDLNINR